jgi:hypothetical protein
MTSSDEVSRDNLNSGSGSLSSGGSSFSRGRGKLLGVGGSKGIIIDRRIWDGAFG